MNDTMTLSQRADALEAKMAQDLDYIVIKSRLYSMAEGDMGPAPNAGGLMKDNPERARLYGRRPASAEDAGEADPAGLLQVPLRPAQPPAAERQARHEGRLPRRRSWPACCTIAVSASSAATTATGARSSSSPTSRRR